MTTEYRIRLDRGACEGVFACLVRDDRFVEAADGLAAVDGGGDDGSGVAPGGTDGSDELLVSFADERLEDAKQAARACPVDAIDVTEAENE